MGVWCVCICLFCVCVVLCLSRGLATSWSLIQGVLLSVKWSWNWKAEARAQGGCRASEKKILSSISTILVHQYTGFYLPLSLLIEAVPQLMICLIIAVKMISRVFS
jgi:hypothetical protein